MTDLQPLVADSFVRLADLLAGEPDSSWDAPSLCSGWRVREVIAHVTMPARMTDEQFFVELAAFGGDFGSFSDAVAARDSALPIGEHLDNLRSPALARWQPPGGGAIGALNHAVVHGLDVTNALDVPRACDDEAATAILDSLTAGGVAAMFGIATSDLQLTATDLAWTWGEGSGVAASSGVLISLLCHRTLRDGRTLADVGGSE